MEAKTKKRVIIAVIVAVVAIVACICFWPSKKTVNFTTQAIAVDTVQSTVTATGSVAPVDEVTVGTQVSGKVTKIYVDYNSHVTKGELLAELDQSTLQETLNKANANYQSALSALTLARQNYARTKTLYAQKAATKSDLEDVENSLSQAQQSVKSAATNVNEAKVNLSYTKIYSPINGIVLSREIEEGQTVASSFSTPELFTIAKDLKDMQVEANIDEADIGDVKVGQKVTFNVDSYSGRTFTGTVKQIRLNPTTTSNVVTYTVIIATPNPDESLYPGMTANITIITSEKVAPVVTAAATNFTPSDDVLKLLGRQNAAQHKGGPDGAPKDGASASQQSTSATTGSSSKTTVNGNKTKTVWVKKGNDIHPQEVKVGMGDGVNYVINSGLQVGDTVVTAAEIGKKEKVESGSNLFMPSGPKHEQKNSSKQETQTTK